MQYSGVATAFNFSAEANRLHQDGLSEVSNILHEYRGAVHDFDRDIIEVVDRWGHCIGANGVLLVAHLSGVCELSQAPVTERPVALPPVIGKGARFANRTIPQRREP